MSQPVSQPAPRPAPPSAAQPVSQPVSLTRALAAHGVLSALGFVAAVLVVVLRDDLVDSWAEGGSGRVAALEAGDIDAPAFVPVALVLAVVLVSLVWVLCAFVRLGYGWARVVLTGSVVFMAVATVAGIRTDPPTTFVAIGWVSFAIEAVGLVLLWHPDTTAWIRGTWRADPPDPPGPSGPPGSAGRDPS